MHEAALLKDLVREIESVAGRERASAVTCVRVRIGPMSHMTPDHFVEHFVDATRGTIAEARTARSGRSTRRTRWRSRSCSRGSTSTLG